VDSTAGICEDLTLGSSSVRVWRPPGTRFTGGEKEVEGRHPSQGVSVHDLGLRDYLRVLRRRKWIVLEALVLVPVAAVALSLRQSPQYQSSADVLLRYQSLPSTLSGISDPNSYSYYIDPSRSTDTSLQVAALPILADRVTAALRKKGVTAADVGSTSVAEVGSTDVLRFTSTTGAADTAPLIATEYARQFTRYFEQLDTGSITRAIQGLEKRIGELQAQDTRQARLDAADLRSKVNQLQTLLTLRTSTAVVIRTADGAAKIRPTPKKYGLLGIGLGLVLGIGLAFLRDAFDTRLRTANEIGDLLKMPVLARIPPPPRRLERERQLVMLADPSATGADAFRRMRMNLEFAAIGKPSQVVMVASAVAQEGKSTTFANLAVALALGGKSVALVDLDLHRPTLARFFRIDDGQPGLSGVVLGHVSVDEALVPIAIGSERTDGTSWNGSRTGGGSLAVLPTGILPPDPGEFVGLEGVRHVVGALRDRFDIVLIDAPPLLAVGDGLTIAGFADAVVVIVRSDLARRPVTLELEATLSRLPIAKLGFAVCGDAGFDATPYADQYGYGYTRSREKAAR
jgi:Mrp family chromosome partitioning ATPase/capsular polysaccharide biosynthesis protein